MEGWKALPRSHPSYSATKRLYLNPQGEIVSRRQYDNARLQGEGWQSKADYDSRLSAHKDRGYARWLEAAEENTGLSRRELGRADSEFNQLFLDARDDKWSKDPNGSFAQFLEAIGVRESGADYAVGESPKA